MSDERPPVPRYGEYADPDTVRAAGGAAPAVAPVAAPAPVAPMRKARTADVAVTSVLLSLGLLVTLYMFVAIPLMPQSIAQAAEMYGVDDYQPGPVTALVQWITGISHVVLFLAAVAIAVPLMVRRRIAFWAPLTAGFVAALVYWGAHISLFFADPQLAEVVSGV